MSQFPTAVFRLTAMSGLQVETERFTPKRKGFGSTILLDGAKQFDANVSLKYEPEGLRYELRFPLSAVEAAKQSLGPPR